MQGRCWVGLVTWALHRRPLEIVELTRMLERAFRESHALDSDSLCIKADQKVD